MGGTCSDQEEETHKPLLQSNGAGAMDGGGKSKTRNNAGYPKRWPFKAGQEISCEVLKRYQNGYLLKVPGDLIGFTESQDVLEPGQLITRQFVCISRAYKLVLLTSFKPSKPLC